MNGNIAAFIRTRVSRGIKAATLTMGVRKYGYSYPTLGCKYLTYPMSDGCLIWSYMPTTLITQPDDPLTLNAESLDLVSKGTSALQGVVRTYKYSCLCNYPKP